MSRDVYTHHSSVVSLELVVVHTGDNIEKTFDIRATNGHSLSTELNMFNFGDNVDSTGTNRRQIGDKVESRYNVVDFRLCKASTIIASVDRQDVLH